MILHQSVLLNETLHYLNCSREGTFVDCTAGAGGHSLGIISNSGKNTRLICLDVDEEALKLSKERLSSFADRVIFHRRNFKEIKDVLNESGVGKVSGIIADLGVSSMQLEIPERGFSFRKKGPLDMRMDKRLEKDARLLVNSLPEKDLVSIIFRFGEERFAKRIASKIVKTREKREITQTSELADLIRSVVPRRDIDPATKTFQAIRIAVNRELEGLDGFIRDAVGCLEVSGRIVMISFHSLEDRVVKQTFRNLAADCVCPKGLPECLCNGKSSVKLITAKPVMAQAEEVMRNPRARSAKLRALEKVY